MRTVRSDSSGAVFEAGSLLNHVMGRALNDHDSISHAMPAREGATEPEIAAGPAKIPINSLRAYESHAVFRCPPASPHRFVWTGRVPTRRFRCDLGQAKYERRDSCSDSAASTRQTEIHQRHGHGRYEPRVLSAQLRSHKERRDWTATSGTRYDIEATTEERALTEERYHQMLQMLLVDRFHLKLHWETHDEPVYLLVADKLGLKLKSTDPASCAPVPPDATLTPNGTACGRPYGFTRALSGLHFEGVGMTTKTLAVVLGLSGRPVIDRTGHEGLIDVKLDFTPANRLSTEPADGPPSIFDALPEQLGVRLQAATAPVDEVIIDHIEKPSDN